MRTEGSLLPISLGSGSPPGAPGKELQASGLSPPAGQPRADQAPMSRLSFFCGARTEADLR